MSGSVNKVILVGNLVRDPEVRTLNSGERVANFSLATSEQWKDKSTGERKEKAEFHRVVVFNDNLVGIIEKYVKKGSTVYLEGSLQTRKWTDQNGIEKFSTEVVLQRFNGTLTLLGGGEKQEREPTGGGQSHERPASQGQNFDPSDEIPF